MTTTIHSGQVDGTCAVLVPRGTARVGRDTTEDADDVGAEERRLERLFQQHHLALWRFAVRMTGDSELSRDLTQETFLRALTHRVPPEERAAEAWLMQTLVNLCRDMHRRRRVRRLHRDGARAAAQPLVVSDPESAVVARSALDAAISGLSVRRRAVLVLHELEGRPPEEIAGILGLRTATVRWHLSRARSELQQRLAGAETHARRTR